VQLYTRQKDKTNDKMNSDSQGICNEDSVASIFTVKRQQLETGSEQSLQRVPPKRRLALNGLHGAALQETLPCRLTEPPCADFT
jgi:hypothetical protein